jgi:uncharacterized protein (TIGR02452 family)
MYDCGRRDPKPLYTYYMIYSPAVPFFRDDSAELLTALSTISVITAATSNAKECTHAQLHCAVRETLKNRLRKVILCAVHYGQRVLMLGGFGCGVFGNN